MKKGDKVTWRGLLAVILSFANTNAIIKIIGQQGKGNIHVVPFNQLTPYVRYARHYLDCPDCGLGYPNYRSGVECPACSYKESITFKKFIEMFQPALPFMQKERNPESISHKNKDDYIKDVASGGHKTEKAAEVEVSLPVNNEKIIEIHNNAAFLPSIGIGVAFVHLKAKKLEFGEHKERILAFIGNVSKNDIKYQDIIGGMVIKDGLITDVWVSPEYRKEGLYKELRKFATQKGFPDLNPEELTSPSYRTAQAKYDWQRTKNFEQVSENSIRDFVKTAPYGQSYQWHSPEALKWLLVHKIIGEECP